MKLNNKKLKYRKNQNVFYALQVDLNNVTKSSISEKVKSLRTFMTRKHNDALSDEQAEHTAKVIANISEALVKERFVVNSEKQCKC